MSECLCGARGGGANYPAAPGAVATKLRMTNELSAGGSRGGRSSSPGGGREELSGGGGLALRSQRLPRVSVALQHTRTHNILWLAGHSVSTVTHHQHHRPTRRKTHPFCLLLQKHNLSIKFCHVWEFFCHSAAEEKCQKPPDTRCISYIIICSSD